MMYLTWGGEGLLYAGDSVHLPPGAARKYLMALLPWRFDHLAAAEQADAAATGR
jgi:hypothetical protein